MDKQALENALGQKAYYVLQLTFFGAVENNGPFIITHQKARRELGSAVVHGVYVAGSQYAIIYEHGSSILQKAEGELIRVPRKSTGRTGSQ